MHLNKNFVKELALFSGFKLSEQPDGQMDLNPSVYAFAQALVSKLFNEELIETAKSVSRSMNEYEHHLFIVERRFPVHGFDEKLTAKIDGYHYVYDTDFGRIVYEDFDEILAAQDDGDLDGTPEDYIKTPFRYIWTACTAHLSEKEALEYVDGRDYYRVMPVVVVRNGEVMSVLNLLKDIDGGINLTKFK